MSRNILNKPIAEVPLVFCIVLNWNGSADTIRCVDALAAQDYPNLTTTVVDNGSTDDSTVQIRAACPITRVLEMGENRGFAAGMNAGIGQAGAVQAEFVWLLNNDTIAAPETLSRLIAAAAPGVGAVGSVLLYADDPARVQAWGGGEISLWTGFVRHYTAPAELRSNSFLTFASVLVRMQAIREIGPLDEGYFLYFEDVDFCFRLRRAGWKLAVAADTAVLHREGATTGRSPATRVVTASGLRFLRSHAPAAMPLYLLLRVGKRLVRGDWPGVRQVWLGLFDWWDDRRR